MGGGGATWGGRRHSQLGEHKGVAVLFDAAYGGGGGVKKLGVTATICGVERGRESMKKEHRWKGLGRGEK